MKAVLRKTRISPKKANLVAGMVRRKKVTEALALLKFMPKKAATTIYKVVHSAAYNAKNNYNQPLEDLYITNLLVTKGPTYKRSIPISRGRMHPILKRTSHITVEVGVLTADGKVKEAPKPNAVKVEDVKPEPKAKKETKKVEKAVKKPAKKETKEETKPKKK